jgi:hypothetical protein
MNKDAPVLTLELKSAFAALQSYDSGGKRSALLPIDNAVVRSLEQPELREELERSLIDVLSGPAPYPARQYACGQLALIGTRASTQKLGALLADPKLAADARSALEAIPDEAAARVLMAELPKLSGLEKAGVIHSLGVSGYEPAARLIRKELVSTDPAIRNAVARALELLSATSPASTRAR